MPMIMCRFCEYVGSGDDALDWWNDVAEHERQKHPDQMREMGEEVNVG